MSQTRQYFRIPDSQGIPVQISLQEDPVNFEAELWGLVFNESPKGCAMILVCDQKFVSNQTCFIKFPDLSPLSTRIAWVQSIQDHVMILGIEYLTKST